MLVGIVGGLGFIGSCLQRRFSASNVRYRVIDKREGTPREGENVRADVRDAEGIARAVAGCDCLVNLAAEHRDDVTPLSLYDEVNIGGARNVCDAARKHGISRIIFTSSVAVYGFAPRGTTEDGALNPFNEYGRTKMLAEDVYRSWQAEDPERRSLSIVRPTVVFGEGNRGNVYFLLSQIAGKWFVMIGGGKNIKSLAYVENVAAFLHHLLAGPAGVHLFNYIDEPNLEMNELVQTVCRLLGKKARLNFRIPYGLGLAGGTVLDLAGRILNRKMPVSSIRVRKFCADTEFTSTRRQGSGFSPPFSLENGLERTVKYEFLDRISGSTWSSE